MKNWFLIIYRQSKGFIDSIMFHINKNSYFNFEKNRLCYFVNTFIILTFIHLPLVKTYGRRLMMFPPLYRSSKFSFWKLIANKDPGFLVLTSNQTPEKNKKSNKILIIIKVKFKSKNQVETAFDKFLVTIEPIYLFI